jgi:peptide/nickel transport system substrate-binding protein
LGKAWSLIAAASLLTIGCTAAGVSPPSPAAETGGPKYGGVLNLRITEEPYDWDISHSGKAIGGGNNINFAQMSLLGNKYGPGIPYNDRIVRPELAERWEVSPDAKTYTFYLKKGVKWVNQPPVNGREFTSADVKFSYEYAGRQGEFKDNKNLTPGQYAWMFEGLERVDTPDPYTAVVRFKEPFAPFLNYAASDYAHMYAREIYQEDGHFKNRVSTLGPFYYDKAASQTGTRVVWKKNSDYFETGKPYVDEVRFLMIGQDSSAFAAFQTKQLDGLKGRILPRGAKELKAQFPQAQMFEYYLGDVWRWYINTRRAPLDNPLVRRAMNRAIDRQEFIKVAGDGTGKVGLDGTMFGLFSDEEIARITRYDLDEAKRLLAQAGYPNGVTIETTFPGNHYGEEYVTNLQLMQAQLKKAGINLELKSIDKGDWSNNRRKSEYFLGLQGGGVIEGDPDSWLYGAAFSTSQYNYNGVKDPKMDQMILAQRREVDQNKRRELWQQISLYMLEEQAYFVGMAAVPEYEFWQPYIKNYAPNDGSVGTPIYETWLDGK